jgi:hypothetical protein
MEGKFFGNSGKGCKGRDSTWEAKGKEATDDTPFAGA